jgi:ribose/xylose/arabinose/galactoside ABC-type transport system permease subunit
MANTAVPIPIAPRLSRARAVRAFVLDNMIWFILVGMVIFAYILNPVFLTPQNLLNLLVHFSVLGILVIALSFCLLTGNFDLSIESTVGFTAMVAAWMMLTQTNASGWNVHPAIAILVMFVLGVIIGLINGFCIVKIGLNPFIVTLSMLIILRGLTLVLTGGMMLYNLPKGYTWIGQGFIAGVPIPAILLIVSFIIAHIVISRRPFGRELYAIGGNKEAALASGINVNRRVMQVFVISSVLATFAGWVLAARLGSVITNLGQGMVFDCFAAAVIGGVSLQGGRGTMIGALGGVLLLGIISNSLILAKVSPFWIDAIRGMLILLAMIIDAIKLRVR